MPALSPLQATFRPNDTRGLVLTTTGWQFPPNHGGMAQGFNHGGIDTFAGTKLSSTVREVVQNSLDAQQDRADPVSIRFSIHAVPSERLENLSGLSEHLRMCQQMAETQRVDNAIDFYKSALGKIRAAKKVPILAISDANTTGLTGPLDEAYGQWFALTKGSGITQKVSGSLGSFGHGSMAPFSISTLRTLYYFSRIADDQRGFQDRFQGKSILQSHQHPTTHEMTQGIGWYGTLDGLRPLLDDSVPTWARELREYHSNGSGTTLLIPFPAIEADDYAVIRAVVVANFFYAILQNNLKVYIGDELIDQSNITLKFTQLKNEVDEYISKVDIAHLKECFQSIESITNPTEQGIEEILNFGKVKWFIRVDDEIARRSVGIARESGMLITRRPPKLERFKQKKNFDLFIFVDAGEGSNILKRLENPAHDRFEFDRVKGAGDEKKIKRLYGDFVDQVKEIIDAHAGLDSADEVTLSELDEILASSDGSHDGGNNERGNRIRFSRKSPKRPRGLNPTGTAASSGQMDEAGSGNRNDEGLGHGGDSSNHEKGQALDGNSGRTLSGTDHVEDKVVQLPVQGLRITRVPNQPSKVKVFFTTTQTGHFSLSLGKIGEVGAAEPIIMLRDGRAVSKVKVELPNPGRHAITLELQDISDLDFAIGGWLDEP